MFITATNMPCLIKGTVHCPVYCTDTNGNCVIALVESIVWLLVRVLDAEREVNCDGLQFVTFD
jgi:hypothetical protein